MIFASSCSLCSFKITHYEQSRQWQNKIPLAVPSLSMARRHELPSERVTNALRQRIKDHEWEPGEALPTVDELCEAYEVSRATASKALAVLQAEGLVVIRPRWGSFVAESRPRDLRKKSS
jgi:DNA-binding GntR family transcriptional regulator